MATPIDNNEADEKSGKSMCQLINIRCTSTANSSFGKTPLLPSTHGRRGILLFRPVHRRNEILLIRKDLVRIRVLLLRFRTL
mgnify:CR=1 FL=1